MRLTKNSELEKNDERMSFIHTKEKEQREMTSKKVKVSDLLDHIDINQLKLLIDEAGYIVLQIKNYGTLNIGNYDDESIEESDSIESTTEEYSTSSTEDEKYAPQFLFHFLAVNSYHFKSLETSAC